MSETITFGNAHLQMRIDPQGGRLLSLSSLPHQRAVLREGEGKEAGDCGLFPMLPVANRVAGNAFLQHGRQVSLPSSVADPTFFLHGDGWLKRWQVASASQTGCVLRLQSQWACGYHYAAELRYWLEEATLHAALTITHLGEPPMLYGCGFHPFFAFDDRSTLQFSASGYWPEGDEHLPLDWQQTLPGFADFSEPQYGEDRWLNVGYSGWGGRAVIRHDVMAVTISAQTPWLMLFRTPGGAFICLEPQTHPVDAHHMPGQPGLRYLSQGECCHFAMNIAVV